MRSRPSHTCSPAHLFTSSGRVRRLRNSLEASRHFEPLEPRALLALNPTGDEQYMLELLNRFRTDPVNELTRLLDGFGTPAHSPFANINAALQFFETSGATLQEQFATLIAVAPLAWNEDLYQAAEFHTQQQIFYDQQSHQIANPPEDPGYVEPNLESRATQFGYTNYSTLGENVFAFTEDVLHGHAGFAIDWGDTPSGIQSPPGHRNSMLNSAFREVGIRILPTPGGPRDTGPLVVTQDFGARFNQGNPYLLGVVFNDLDDDAFYTSGEGLNAVTITIVGTGSTVGSYSTATFLSGGYQIQVPAGTYNVTFSGGTFGDAATFPVTVGSQNVKLDAPKGIEPPAPIARVSGNSVVIADGDTTPTSTDWTGFGGVNTSGQTLTRIFTITNAGTADLILSATLPRVTITGAGAARFTLTMDAADATLAPGESTTFSIRFDPTVVGLVSAIVNISTSDPDVPTYNFTIQGRGIQRGVAEIEGRDNLIENGSTTVMVSNGTTFGSTPVPGGASIRVYTITNVGAGTLNLLGANPVTITGPGAARFQVTLQPADTSLAEGESTTFRVRFLPITTGPLAATINVATSDQVNANYSYLVRGTGKPTQQATVVNGPGEVIPNGDTTPSALERTDYGNVGVGFRLVRWFSIKNTGFANLSLTSISIGGGDSAQFVLPSQAGIMPQTIAPGAKVSFFIRFRPLTTGLFTTTVTVATNDPFRPNYTFDIAGTGV